MQVQVLCSHFLQNSHTILALIFSSGPTLPPCWPVSSTDSHTLTLTGAGSTITWNSIVDKPGTSSYAAARNSRFDEVHVVVIDGDGEVTGNSGTILEKHISLSKAKLCSVRRYKCNNSKVTSRNMC